MTEYSAINDPSARTLAVDDLATAFLPSYEMLGASRRHQGAEILRRVEDLEAAAPSRRTIGIGVDVFFDAVRVGALA